jgi:hypothetical protein
MGFYLGSLSYAKKLPNARRNKFTGILEGKVPGVDEV